MMVLVKYVGAGHEDVRSNGGPRFVSSRADAVVESASRPLGSLPRSAPGLVGRNDFGDKPAVFVLLVRRGEQLRVARIEGQIDVNVTVSLVMDGLHRARHGHAGPNNLEPVRVVDVGQWVAGAAASGAGLAA